MKYPKMYRMKGEFFCIKCNAVVEKTTHFLRPGHAPLEPLEPVIMAHKRAKFKIVGRNHE